MRPLWKLNSDNSNLTTEPLSMVVPICTQGETFPRFRNQKDFKYVLESFFMDVGCQNAAVEKFPAECKWTRPQQPLSMAVPICTQREIDPPLHFGMPVFRFQLTGSSFQNSDSRIHFLSIFRLRLSGLSFQNSVSKMGAKCAAAGFVFLACPLFLLLGLWRGWIFLGERFPKNVCTAGRIPKNRAGRRCFARRASSIMDGCGIQFRRPLGEQGVTG